MTLLVGLLFLVLWAAALYAGIIIFGRRYFGPGRTETAATIATLAFVIGNAVFPLHPQSAQTAAAPDVSARDAFPVVDAGVPVEACANILFPANANAGGSIDFIHDEATNRDVVDGVPMQTNQGFFVTGWAADVTGSAPPRAICVAIDGHIVTDALVTLGLPRPDVARALKSPRLLRAGFRIHVNAGVLSPGHHRLDIVVLSQYGNTSTLRQGKTVEVI